MRQHVFIVLSISFLLYVMGLMSLSMMSGYAVLNFWEQKLLVIVELRDDVAEETLNQLQVQLENANYVVPSTLDIITKDEAAEQLKTAFGEDYLSEDIPNPLHHVYTFNVVKTHSDTASLERIRQDLRQNEGVFEVYYEKNLSQNISKNLSNLLWYVLGFSILFIFVAIFMVNNVIKLNLEKQKALITAPEEDWRLPTSSELLMRSLKNALWSAAIAILALIASSYWLFSTFAELNMYIQGNQIVLLFCVIGVVSVLIYIVGSWFASLKSSPKESAF